MESIITQCLLHQVLLINKSKFDCYTLINLKLCKFYPQKYIYSHANFCLRMKNNSNFNINFEVL